MEITKIEELAKELNSVRVAKNQLAKREKEIIEILIKDFFDKDSHKEEKIDTDNYILVKYPALSGERYNVDDVRKLAIRTHKRLITTKKVYKADENALKELVRDKILSEEDFEALKIISNRIKVNVK